MKNHLEEIFLGLNLDRSNVISYFQKGDTNDVMLKIRSKEDKYLEFLFSEVIFFLHHGDDICISKLYINYDKTDLFMCAIKNAYQPSFYPIPEPIQERFFQFYDYDNKLSLEIISKNFTFKIY